MSSSPPTIRYQFNDHTASIILHRSASLNSFKLEMAREFLRALAEANSDPQVRVIVVRGAGKIFSAGGDIPEMLGYVEEGSDPAAYFRDPLAEFGKMSFALRQSPKPVIAAVHGAVAGYAFNLVLSCDMVLAEESTRFMQAFIKVGLSPDGGGTWLLPRLVGYQRACELTLMPSEIDARKALDWGLINWIAPQAEFEDRLQDITAQLANSPAEAIRRTKELLNDCWEHPFAEHIEKERLAQFENAFHPDFGEGLRAFSEGRTPDFIR